MLSEEEGEETDLEDGDAALRESWCRRVDLQDVAVGHDASSAGRALAAKCHCTLRRGREEEKERREAPVSHREGLVGSSVGQAKVRSPVQRIHSLAR